MGVGETVSVLHASIVVTCMTDCVCIEVRESGEGAGSSQGEG